MPDEHQSPPIFICQTCGYVTQDENDCKQHWQTYHATPADRIRDEDEATNA